jgi:hypothetical protein
MELAQVENMCRKIRSCQYLLDSDAVQIFMDPRNFQTQIETQLNKLVKLTSTSGDALNRFKQCFSSLSGKELDQTIFEKIERFKANLSNQRDHMVQFKSMLEKAMTKKVESDTAKTKLFEALADLEEFLGGEISNMKYQMRAEQRVLDKFRELNNDTHWRVLETVDDFVRDQLTDYAAFQEVFSDIAKA